MKKIILICILALVLLVVGCSRVIEEEDIPFWRKEVVEQEQPVAKMMDCKKSAGGSCLKIIESSYRHNPRGDDYDFYDIMGQVQNVGTGKNNRNPWHGLKGSCYFQGRLVDESGSTFDLLEPREIITFKVTIDAKGKPVDECKVRVTY